MRESLYKSYSVKGTALALMLSTTEVKCPVLFDFISEKDKEEDYLYAINEMVNEEMVVPCNGKLDISETYKELVDFISKSTEAVRIRVPLSEGGDCFVYSCSEYRDRLLAMSRSPRRKNVVLLTYLDIKGLFGEYFAEDVLPLQIGAFAQPEEVDFETVQRMVDLTEGLEDIGDIGYLFGGQFIYGGKSEKATIVAFQYDTGVYYALEVGGAITVKIYTKEEFVKDFEKTMKGETDNDNCEDIFGNV